MKDRFSELKARLRKDIKELEEKLKALELAEKLLLKNHPGEQPKKRKKKEKPSAVRDMSAASKLSAFLRERKGPTTVEQVAKRFNITRAAANQRLINAVEDGFATRISRGQYKFELSSIPAPKK